MTARRILTSILLAVLAVGGWAAGGAAQPAGTLLVGDSKLHREYVNAALADDLERVEVGPGRRSARQSQRQGTERPRDHQPEPGL